MLMVIPSVAIAISNNETNDEWVTIKVKNPRFEMPTTKSWVAWDSGEVSPPASDYYQPFVRYTVYIGYVKAYGVKNDDTNQFYIIYVEFQVKYDNWYWSGSNKRYSWNIELEKNSIVLYSDVTNDVSLTKDWVEHDSTWQEYFPYSSYWYYLKGHLAIQKYQSGLWVTKACATSTASFKVN